MFFVHFVAKSLKLIFAIRNPIDVLTRRERFYINQSLFTIGGIGVLALYLVPFG